MLCADNDTERQADRQRDKHANFIYSPLYTEQHFCHIEINLTMALKSVIAGRDINFEVLSLTRSLAATELME